MRTLQYSILPVSKPMSQKLKIRIIWVTAEQMQNLEKTGTQSFKVVCNPIAGADGVEYWGIYLYDRVG